MVFSKSFGYALRSILYVAMISDAKPRVQIHEIAASLKVPRHFLGKIMQQLAREGVIDSVKGPNGGFSVNNKTLPAPLIKIIEITDGMNQFNSCILRLKKCNPDKPCALHHRIESNRKEFTKIFADTTVADLMRSNTPEFISSI
jgi:Rrf2 family protein